MDNPVKAPELTAAVETVISQMVNADGFYKLTREQGFAFPPSLPRYLRETGLGPTCYYIGHRPFYSRVEVLEWLKTPIAQKYFVAKKVAA